MTHPPSARLGTILVNTGDGRGKSTAAYGLALREHSLGQAVKIYQFTRFALLRNAEHVMLGRLGIAIEALSGDADVNDPDVDAAAELARSGWRRAEESIRAGVYGLVVLDEIMHPLRYGWISLDAVIGCLLDRPAHVDVVLTGAGAPQELVRVADTVVEMSIMKVPVEPGVPLPASGHQ